jgi:hypothetical protein
MYTYTSRLVRAIYSLALVSSALRKLVINEIVKFENEEDYEHFGSDEAGYPEGFCLESEGA